MAGLFALKLLLSGLAPTSRNTGSLPVMPKYGNKPTNGFASRREARRYTELALLEKAGQIRALEKQPKFYIKINGHDVCTYTADFAYFDGERRIVEDAKGFRTPVYRLKKKLMKAVFGIDVQEV